MKVAVVHNQPLGTHEAGVAFVAGAATGYAQAGADVAWLLSQGEVDSDAALATLGVPLPRPFALRPMPAIQRRYGPFRPSWAGPFRRAVLAEVQRGGYDVVVVRELKLAAMLAAAGIGPKLVFELHNLYNVNEDDGDAARVFPEKKLKMHQGRAALEREVLAAVDGVIVLTAGLAPLLEPHFGLAGRVGVGGSALHPCPALPKDAARRDIAYIGSLDPHKGVGAVVAALAELPDEIRLLLIGHGRHHEALLRLAVQAGVADRLLLTGWSSPAELLARLAGCFAAAVPLEDCFYNRFVTSPMKLFDYARAGVVPVVPKLPVFVELFAATGGAVFVEGDAPRDYAAALRALHADAGMRQENERRLEGFAAAHTWRHRGEGLLPFFEGLSKR